MKQRSGSPSLVWFLSLSAVLLTTACRAEAAPPARHVALPTVARADTTVEGTAATGTPLALDQAPAPPAEPDVPPDEAFVVPDEPQPHLVMPYRSQFDGSPFEWGYCGVAAISMAMDYYGHAWSTHEVRLAINALTGNWDRYVGVDWRFLVRALAQRGFRVQGPFDGDGRGGYQRWTLDTVLAETAAGRPVLLMAHYRSLPGHEDDPWIGDHYLLVLGHTRDGQIVYHDPGFVGEAGAYRTIERAVLEHAWSNTWIGQDRTAMVILPP